MGYSKVVFRVDSSNKIGAGHIHRCMALAKAFKCLGVPSVFLTRDLDGNISNKIIKNGFSLKYIRYRCANSPDEFNVKFDITETIQALSKLKNVLLVVDHYDVCLTWRIEIKQKVNTLVLINDFLSDDNYFDYLINQNLYKKKTQKDQFKKFQKKILLGPKFALLSEEYSDYKKQILLTCNGKKSHTQYLTCLINFGGADEDGITLKTVEAIINYGFQNIKFIVVCSEKSIHFNNLNNIATGLDNFQILPSQSSLARLFLKADFAIGAGGVSTWERFCLGLPTIMTSLSSNQLHNVNILGKKGFVLGIKDVTGSFDEDLIKCIKKVADVSYLEKIRERIFCLVDGFGSLRVALILNGTSGFSLSLRRVSFEDIFTLLDLRNDPVTIKNSFSSRQITLDEHAKWFKHAMSDTASSRFICEIAGVPVGFIMFKLDILSKWFEISLNIDLYFRGNGIGEEVVKKGLDKVGRQNTFVARVKRFNKASLKLFLKLGFVEISALSDDRMSFLRLDPIPEVG